jgi:glutaredoxin 3
MGAFNSTRQLDFVRETVRENCVVIFSTTTCPYCHMAKDVFSQMGVTAKVIELNQRSDGADIMQALRPLTKMSTVRALCLYINVVFDLDEGYKYYRFWMYY